MTSRIGTALAARLLGWNMRQVQRNAKELGGEMVADRWTFDESRVLERVAAQNRNEANNAR